MNGNFFTRCCLQDRWLLEAKYRTIGGAGRSAGGAHSIQSRFSIISGRQGSISSDVQDTLDHRL